MPDQRADALDGLLSLRWDDLRVSCPDCAAPAGVGCFARWFGHQKLRVHRARREKEQTR